MGIVHVTPEARLFQERWRLRQNPFLVSSAENLQDSDILRLFVAEPESSLAAFIFNVNNIIRGIYGSGKTMCLRAVEAFAFSQAIVDLIQNGRTPVIPVRVNLSEIGHISNADDIYREVILRIFKGLLAAGRAIERYVASAAWFPTFKDWRDKLTHSGIYAQDARYLQLSAESVTDQAKKSFKVGANFPGGTFLKLLAETGGEYGRTIATKPKPSIADIQDFHQQYLSRYSDRILLLVDEVGSLQPAFFVTKGSAPSGYETLMNQLRTSPSLFYKVCVYPGHYSDTLQESRYGARINLDYSVTNGRTFAAYSNLCRDILGRYIRAVQEVGDLRQLSDFIQIDESKGGEQTGPWRHRCSHGSGSAFEQLCFASGGVLRRLFALTSKAMLSASQAGPEAPRVDLPLVLECLEGLGADLVNRYSTAEQHQLTALADACERKGTYRFSSKLEAQSLLKPFLSKTQQDSVLRISENALNPGRTVYEFDYVYCVARNLPTHRHSNGKSCPARTLRNGVWIDEVADLTDSVLHLSGLTRGVITKFLVEKQYGFIVYDTDQAEVFFHTEDVVDFGGYSSSDDLRQLTVRFAMGDTPKGKKARSIVIEPKE